MSSTDMSFSTTMIRDSTSPCAEGTRPADGMRGRVPVVVLSNEVFSDNDEMGQRHEGLWSVTRSVAAQNPGIPFWDLVRLSIYLSIYVDYVFGVRHDARTHANEQDDMAHKRGKHMQERKYRNDNGKRRNGNGTREQDKAEEAEGKEALHQKVEGD
ncbi:hypothetical protein ARMGADRAFT_1090383 [Armillaria gallica]|uniref:Uncharacterized protein n=1 Tax=Armillaria gallica TaxID=47427 RepID=A0A2H3CH11_ARMGA|nr:hypothetical protein ARMGADRAFT_1090383 [Armillaria gallica]